MAPISSLSHSSATRSLLDQTLDGPGRCSQQISAGRRPGAPLVTARSVPGDEVGSRRRILTVLGRSQRRDPTWSSTGPATGATPAGDAHRGSGPHLPNAGHLAEQWTSHRTESSYPHRSVGSPPLGSQLCGTPGPGCRHHCRLPRPERVRSPARLSLGSVSAPSCSSEEESGLRSWATQPLLRCRTASWASGCPMPIGVRTCGGEPSSWAAVLSSAPARPRSSAPSSSRPP